MKMLRTETETYEVEVPDDLEDFKSWEFSSGTSTGKDFKRFGRLFKKFIRSNIPDESELIKFSTGHYTLHGFVKQGKEVLYFSVSDVRYFKNEWANKILIREAENEKDFTGKGNHFTTLENFKRRATELLEA